MKPENTSFIPPNLEYKRTYFGYAQDEKEAKWLIFLYLPLPKGAIGYTLGYK